MSTEAAGQEQSRLRLFQQFAGSLHKHQDRNRTSDGSDGDQLHDPRLNMLLQQLQLASPNPVTLNLPNLYI